MTRYAQGTEVSPDKSRAEIERTLQRYGATEFGYFWRGDKAAVQFALGDRHIRLMVPLPDRDAPEFRLTPSGRWERSPTEQQRAWEQACRQRWRALKLVIQAKLEAVESGISTLEQEFLANIVLPDSSTVGEWAVPQIARAYELGAMPPMLPALAAPTRDGDAS